jgi:RNA polymerase sigma-70 factor (ECF subfamily)
MEHREESRQLVTRILEGNTDEFQTVIERYKKLVAHIVFKMVTIEADREDICQDVFVKVFQKLGSFKFESKLSTWIATIAYNTSLNYLEKKRVPLVDDLMPEENGLERIPTELVSPEDTTDNRNISEVLIEEIDQLPVQYGTILVLYHLEEMPYKEISKITGMPDGTVKSHLFRARKLLKDRLLAKYKQEDLCR